MKILVIHQYYLRPGEPGGSRFNEMSKIWVREGHEVTVLAGQVHYALQDGGGGQFRTEVEDRDGVEVMRVYTPKSFHKGILGRMISFAGFGISASLAVLLMHRKFDVVIASSPSLMVVLPGLLGHFLKAWPWIFEVRDLWPESAVTTGVLRKDGWITKGLELLEAWGYRYANKINVLTPAFKQNIVDRGLAEEQKIIYIPNGADLELFKPGPKQEEIRKRYGWGDRFVVIYTGAHGRANHLIQWVDLAERLKGQPEILLVAVGDGPERRALIRESEKRGLSNIQWLAPVPKEEMPGLLQSADIGAAVLQNNPTFKTVYPNKIFDYFSCAKPVFCAIDGMARTLVEEEARAGLYAPAEDIEAMAQVVMRFFKASKETLEAWGKNGYEYVREHFDRRTLALKYLKEMQGL